MVKSLSDPNILDVYIRKDGFLIHMAIYVQDFE